MHITCGLVLLLVVVESSRSVVSVGFQVNHSFLRVSSPIPVVKRARGSLLLLKSTHDPILIRVNGTNKLNAKFLLGFCPTSDSDRNDSNFGGSRQQKMLHGCPPGASQNLENLLIPLFGL